MKTTREWKQVTITKKGTKKLQSGHPWVYEGEVLALEANIQNGDIVDVFSEKGSYQGSGLYNGNSRIRIRLLSRNANDRFDEDFFYRRLQHAISYRATVMGEDFDACRLIFGEADFIPGFVVDKFSDVLVVQSLALGIDRYKEMLVELLKKVLAEDGIQIRGVYERSDVKVRKQEGMEPYKGFIGEEFSTLVEIVENGVKYQVDVKDGQKTGFFLDQKYNRLAIQKLCKNARVLDCFTHTGSFALNAGYAGAKEVTGVDASQLAVDQATANAALNGLSDTVKFICEDVFDLLPALEEKGEKYDVVILDPPAFTKSRSSIKNAVKGYREINLRAMKLVKDGGFLATCSCSHFMDYELFTQTIGQAAKNVHFVDAVMNPVVHLGLDQALKAVHNFFLFIQFYCADFYDFERQTAVGPPFPSRTLIPLQVKYNVVHDKVPSVSCCESRIPAYPCSAFSGWSGSFLHTGFPGR